MICFVNSFSLIFLLFQSSSLSLIIRPKRGAYDLPAGVVQQLGLTEVKKTFKCESDGYFADVDNECKLYHVCHNNGKTQSTMACGLTQLFDQSKLVCNHESDAIPCQKSSEFFYLNERIGNPNAQFLTEEDIDRAKNARPDYKAA